MASFAGQDPRHASLGATPAESGVPTIALPKGGGAIRGVGEKFAANPVTGTGAMSVPIAVSPARSGFGPQLSLGYDSGSGNGPFGFGWNLSTPSITRKTDKGLPQYLDAQESDVFILSGTEDLVSVLVEDQAGVWVRPQPSVRLVDQREYRVERYRPRVEGLFARIERWTSTADASDVFWRSISKDNVTTWYGRTAESRIVDPQDPGRVFSWLICQSHDDKGNVIVYGYKAEDSTRIFQDAGGNALVKAHECNRTAASRSAQRYLKRIRYGNRAPYYPELRPDTVWPEPVDAAAADASGSWLFEVVLDYGEHDADTPTPGGVGEWPARCDPFSSYRAGFEVRTYRTCQRVLMFHHFPGEEGVGSDCLVRSTDFTYSDELDPAAAENPVYTFLRSVTQVGYRRDGAGYLRRCLPPVEFEYSQPVVQDVVEDVDPASVVNLPVGLDGSTYRWVDLHGEGIPGILTEQAGAWYYKRNLSPLPATGPDGDDVVRARFGELETVAAAPTATLTGGAEFMDLAGDGQPDLVMMSGAVQGLYEHDDADGWQPFRPFTSVLTRDLSDPNLKLVDLDGDGHADVLITEADALVWHPSLAEDGFGPATRVPLPLDEERGPRVVFADGSQSIHLADLSGDGLSDIVRIRNGEVCYWPNLGHGRFGAKVTMDNARRFDNPDQFDPGRVRLADIDGSGTTDIIYLHRDGVRLYFNQSGNSWSTPHTLAAFPPVDDVASIMALDLLGNGTACLVWSSPLPGDAGRPMRYVNLMGATKPHLLIRSVNNLGAETRLTYTPSTAFYLRDRAAGRPWLTRLPFPVHVVERVETYDYISRSRFVTRYAYHHGDFDGEEREFRGFGMVEQWDTERYATLADGALPADNIDEASHVPPVLTKTWFHTGAHFGRGHVSDYFAGLLDADDGGEYYREPGLSDSEARALLLEDTILPGGLSAEEEREASRTLKGSMLRQEVYAEDGTPDAKHPYTVTEQNFAIRTLQPRGGNHHAVFLTHARESISYHYERNPADPRVQHTLTLEVDAFGNVLKQAAVGYGRRQQIREVDDQGRVRLVPNPGLTELDDTDRARQTTPLLTYTEHRVTTDPQTGRDAIDRADEHRLPLPCEAITFELTSYPASGPVIGPATTTKERIHRHLATDFVQPDPAATGRLRRTVSDEVPYEASPTAGTCRRPVEHVRTLYRRDDLTGLLPLGALNPRALPGETYSLAFTPGLLTAVYQRPSTDCQPGKVLMEDPGAVLAGKDGARGGYLASQTLRDDGLFPATEPADHWWVPSGQVSYTTDQVAPAVELAQARRGFFLPRRYRNPFGHDALVDFDTHNLLIVETRDALGNQVTVDANDYRTLQPRLVSDPNRNRTEVAFDVLGMVVGTAVMGKPLPAPVEGDTLAGFQSDPSQAAVDGFFAGPVEATADPKRSQATSATRALLADATTRIVYDLDRFRRTRRANPTEPSTWEPACAATIARETHVSDLTTGQQSRLQVSFTYSDGFGREIQTKNQAEPGLLDPADGSTPQLNPRWVGSGWTVFNNKGKPVRQYQPFFSATPAFELDAIHGVSPVLLYDPAERVVATLHPNHTWEKVAFDPWQQTTWDVNDTVATFDQATPTAGVRDPAADPHVGGLFQRLPNDDLYRPTWYDLRTDPAKALVNWPDTDAQGKSLPDSARQRAHEKAAAERAAAHAETPTTVHLDTLGRPFLTVARNRVVCAHHALDGTEDPVTTRVDLDIEGNQRAVRDERKLPVGHLPTGQPERRVVMRYAYDMRGNRIHQQSMEAGERWTVNDASGQPIRAWDSRGHTFTTTYDELRRPLTQIVRGTVANGDAACDPRTLNRNILVDKIEYGEPAANASQPERDRALRLNLRTRIYRHFDSAGIVTNARLDAHGDPIEAYDFKGNPRHSLRRLAMLYKEIPDWSQNPPPQLDAESFASSTRYDALNRAIQAVAPHSSLTRSTQHPNAINVIQPVFNEANLLERVNVWLERAAEPTRLLDPTLEAPSPVGVATVDYDAQGQRLQIDYINGASTSYTYDRLTFRLTHLVTRRKAGDFPDDDPRPPITGWPGKHLQNLHYTYDPAGNITHIHDDAQQAIYFRNQRIEPSNDYTYDALYRLIQATGREHLGQDRVPIAHSHDDDGRVGLVTPGVGGQFAPNDRNLMARYVERYVYDAVGNFLQMQHRGSDPAHAGWTRAYDYREPSLVEDGKCGALLRTSNRLTQTTLNPASNTPQPETYRHDAHGNILRMPHLGAGAPGPNMHWDYKDQLLRTDQSSDDKTFYVYEASGQRVRKVREKAPGLIEERIYLGNFEIFRKHRGPIGPNTVALERETLHVMDDKQRVVLVETRTLDTAGDDQAPRRLIRYQLGNNLESVSLELDERARVISYEEYAPYGSSTYQAVRSQNDAPKRHRHAGKERDTETGFGYHGARYYAHWLGRWTSTDPGPSNATTSSYSFADNNPANLSDPDGRQAKPPEQMHLVDQQTMFESHGTRSGTSMEKKLRTAMRVKVASWGENPDNYELGHHKQTPTWSARVGDKMKLGPQTKPSNREQAKREAADRSAAAKAGKFTRTQRRVVGPAPKNPPPAVLPADVHRDAARNPAQVLKAARNGPGTSATTASFAPAQASKATSQPVQLSLPFGTSVSRKLNLPTSKPNAASLAKSVVGVGSKVGMSLVPGAAEGLVATEVIQVTAARAGAVRLFAAAGVGAGALGPALVGGAAGTVGGLVAEQRALALGAGKATAIAVGTGAAATTGAAAAISVAVGVALVVGAPVTLTVVAGAAIVGGLSAVFGYLMTKAM